METVIGWSVGTGWAVAVAVVGRDGGGGAVPEVVEKRRVELAGPSESFVFHLAKSRDRPAAELLVADVAKVADEAAAGAVESLVGGFGPGRAVVVGPVPPWDWPDLPDIVRSHTTIHTAEGHLFREAVWDALQAHGYDVAGVPRKGLAERIAAALGVHPGSLQQTLRDMGKPLGAPWRREQKEAVLAAWWGLSGSEG